MRKQKLDRDPYFSAASHAQLKSKLTKYKKIWKQQQLNQVVNSVFGNVQSDAFKWCYNLRILIIEEDFAATFGVNDTPFYIFK